MFKVKQSRTYTTITTYHLKDTELSLAAKGLHTWLLSNLNLWNNSFDGIIEYNNASEEEVMKLLNELQSNGYITVKGDDITVLDKPLNVKKKEIKPIEKVDKGEKKVKNLFEKCIEINEFFTKDIKLRQALREYLIIRINPSGESRLKAFPLTNANQWRSVVNSLAVMSGNKEQIVRQSIANEWAKFIDVGTNSNDNITSKSYTQSQIEEIKNKANNEEGLIF